MTAEPGWTVAVAGPAARDLDRLPEKVVPALMDLFSALEGNPRRLGKPLSFELEGVMVARRGPYRVIYEVADNRRTVTVVAVGHRADVYRSR